jgi:hypothetical protein
MSFTPEELDNIKKVAKKYEKEKEAWGKDKLEVFEQLLKIKAFTEWAKDNININRYVDHLREIVEITVIYKGEYKGTKTSLQRLEEIRELVCEAGQEAGQDVTKEELIDKILEITDYDETQHVMEEENGSEETTN